MVSTANSKSNTSSLPVTVKKAANKTASQEGKGSDVNKTSMGAATPKTPVNVLPAKKGIVKDSQPVKSQNVKNNESNSLGAGQAEGSQTVLPKPVKTNDEKGITPLTVAKNGSNVRLANTPLGLNDALVPQDKPTKPSKISYQGQNLSIASFEKMDPSKVDLNGAILKIDNTDSEAIIKLKKAGFTFKDFNLEGLHFEGNFSDDFFKGANLKGADFTKAQFSGSNFSDINFAGANLKGTTFKDANLKGAKFKDADLNGVHFYNSKFAGPEFAGANLKGATFKYGQFGQTYDHNLKTQNLSSFKDVNVTGATFDGVNFSNIDMHGATLGGATFNESGFYNTSFVGANLKGLELKQFKQLKSALNTDILANADLTGANFKDAVIYGAHLEKVDLSKANLQGATIQSNGHKISLKNAKAKGVKFEGSLQPESLQGANLDGADMRGVQFLQGNEKEAFKGIQFKGVNLKNATFENANLAGASFNGTSLANVNFKNARFAGLELVGADLNGAKLAGAIFGKTPLYEAANLNGVNFKGANLAGANFNGANFNGAKLGGADLRNANFNGAILTGADVTMANFVGADLRGANTQGVDFSKSILKGRPFDPNLDNPVAKDTKSYQGVRLTRKELADMNLRSANLQGATLVLEALDQETSFDGVDLKGVTIEGEVNGNMLRGAKLEGADFRKAGFTSPFDRSFPERNRAYQAKEYEGVNFTGAILTPIQQVSRFEEASIRYRDAGIKEYQYERIRSQKLIDDGKTIETEFHSADHPHKVIPDDKVQGVREAFQKSIIAADKRVINPEFISAYQQQIRQAADIYGDKFVTDLEQIIKTGGGEQQIRALFKGQVNAENDIAYAKTLAGGMSQIFEVDNARTAMVMDLARKVVSQGEFKALRNSLILDHYQQFGKMITDDSGKLLKIGEIGRKAIEDQGVVTKAGIGEVWLADLALQNNWSNNLFDLVSKQFNGPQITPSLKMSTIEDLNKNYNKELHPLSRKMNEKFDAIQEMGLLAQKGQLGASGKPTRAEAEARVGKAWEEQVALRKEALEKIQAHAGLADKVVENGKLGKDISIAALAIALSIPTAGQSLWLTMASGAAIGATLKGGSTALDTATSAKGFDGRAAATDAVIGMFEGALGSGVGRLGKFTSETILKTAGPTLMGRVLSAGSDIGINTLGSAGISQIDPLYKNMALDKPIDPEVLKSRAIGSGLMAFGVSVGMKLPMGKPPAAYSENPLSLNSKPVLYPGFKPPDNIPPALKDSYEFALSTFMRAITLIAFPKR